MTQIFLASTLFGAVTVTAAIDAGLFGPPGRRRMLLVSDNTAIPELGRDLTASPGFAGIRDRFDEVRSWNAEISPLHPSGWMPRTEELMLWERSFRDRWGLGGEPLELAVETIAASPARALTSIFSEAAITVYADGLMSYGPTRDGLPDGVGSRITRLNPARALCVSLATALVLLGATWLGLPVSTTHVAVGGVFGVGFYREWDERRTQRSQRAALPPEELHRRRLVRRTAVLRTLAAWAVTVPITGSLAAAIAWAMG